MKYERKQTTRQEWGKFREEVQEDVNQTLEKVRLDIEAANLVLADYYEADPEKAGEYAQEIIEYLDDEWGYYHDYFFIMGTWHQPEVSAGGQGVLVEHVKQQAFTTARSNGFIVKPIESDDGENEAPRVGFSFIMGSTIQMSSPMIQGNFEALAYAEPHEVSLQYLRPGDDTVVSSDLHEIGDALKRADSLLNLYLNHDSSSFYRISQKKQQEAIKDVLELIEEVLPSPDSLDALMLEAETSVIYVPNYKGNHLMTVSVKDSVKLNISGKVLGVTTGEIAENTTKAFRDPSECGTAAVGLSLIVEPKLMNFDLDDHDGDILVPIRLASNIELSLE